MVDKSGQRVRQMFGEIAPRYDLLNHLLSAGVDHYWRWRAVRRAAPTLAGPILDLCTGTGDLALAYQRAAAGKVQVVGADFCRPMLVRGKEKALATGKQPPVTFIEADAQQLPFRSDAFQIVSVAFGLRNVSDTARGLSEMVRVCQRGGLVVVLEFSQPTWPPLRALYGWYFRHVLPRIGQAVSRNRHDAYNYLPESVGEFPAGAALAEMMTEAGLVDVTFTPLTFGVATLYIGRKP